MDAWIKYPYGPRAVEMLTLFVSAKLPIWMHGLERPDASDCDHPLTAANMQYAESARICPHSIDHRVLMHPEQFPWLAAHATCLHAINTDCGIYTPLPRVHSLQWECCTVSNLNFPTWDRIRSLSLRLFGTQSFPWTDLAALFPYLEQVTFVRGYFDIRVWPTTIASIVIEFYATVTVPTEPLPRCSTIRVGCYSAMQWRAFLFHAQAPYLRTLACSLVQKDGPAIFSQLRELTVLVQGHDYESHRLHKLMLRAPVLEHLTLHVIRSPKVIPNPTWPESLRKVTLRRKDPNLKWLTALQQYPRIEIEIND